MNMGLFTDVKSVKPGSGRRNPSIPVGKHLLEWVGLKRGVRFGTKTEYALITFSVVETDAPDLVKGTLVTYYLEEGPYDYAKRDLIECLSAVMGYDDPTQLEDDDVTAAASAENPLEGSAVKAIGILATKKDGTAITRKDGSPAVDVEFYPVK
jgi:hypothetical protein